MRGCIRKANSHCGDDRPYVQGTDSVVQRLVEVEVGHGGGDGTMNGGAPRLPDYLQEATGG